MIGPFSTTLFARLFARPLVVAVLFVALWGMGGCSEDSPSGAGDEDASLAAADSAGGLSDADTLLDPDATDQDGAGPDDGGASDDAADSALDDDSGQGCQHQSCLDAGSVDSGGDPPDTSEDPCGDGTCWFGENCQNCPQDCTQCFCGDGACSAHMGESCDSCNEDCRPCTPTDYPACNHGFYSWPNSWPPNLGGVKKWGAVVTCQTTHMLYDPSREDTPENRVVGIDAQPVVLEQGQHVLIQEIPGAILGQVWVDPDLYGVAYSQVQMQRKFGRNDVPGGTTSYFQTYPRMQRRGWVPLHCLQAGRSGSDYALPTNWKPWCDGDECNTCMDDNCTNYSAVSATTRYVKPVCDITGAYENTRTPPNINGMSTYGTHVPFGRGIYNVRSTTSVRGGGMTNGYALIQEPVQVLWEQPCRDHNQFLGVDGSRDHTHDVRSKWSYVRSTVDGVPGSYYWLPSQCLDDQPTLSIPQAPTRAGLANCEIRCCDDSLFFVPTTSNSACRAESAACEDRGKTKRMRRSGQVVYTREQACP